MVNEPGMAEVSQVPLRTVFGLSLEGPLGELLPGDLLGVWIDSERVLGGFFLLGME